MKVLGLLACVMLVACNLGDPEEEPFNNENNVNNTADTGDDVGNANNENNLNNTQDVGQDQGVDMPVDMGPTPLTLEEFCDARGLAWANELYNCYSYGPYPAYYYDPSDPNAARQWSYNCRGYQRNIDAGTMTYDGVEAAKCAAAMAAVSDQCIGGLEPHTVLPECQNVVVGIAAPGTSCYQTEECTDGHYCRTDNACPGSCTRYAADGESCANGNRCDYTVSNCDFNQNQICVDREAAGGTCTESYECLDGFCVNGVCRGWSDFGDACDDNMPCRNGETNSTDDDVVHQCNDGVCSFKAGAGECLYEYHCQVGQWCERPDPDSTGSCVDLPALSQACGNGFLCAAGLFCLNNVCESAAAENELCNAGIPCANSSLHFCMADGRCHPRGGLGDPCAVDQFGTCDVGLVCNPETNLCGQRAADGGRCNPRHGLGEQFYEGQNTPACEDGLACLCQGGNCNQNDINTPHFCSPINDPNITPCRSIADCGEQEYCDQYSNSGVPICRQGGGCERR